MSLMSALGWVLRTVLTRGSSTGLTPPRGEANRPSRRLTPVGPDVLGPDPNPSGVDRSRGIDLVAELAESAPSLTAVPDCSLAGAPTDGAAPLPATGTSWSRELRPAASWVTPPSAILAVATSPATAAPRVS